MYARVCPAYAIRGRADYYEPHAPHEVTVDVDRYRATVVRSGALWTFLLLGQNHHLVHHLFPAVPFHRLASVWRARRAELVAHGAGDKSV